MAQPTHFIDFADGTPARAARKATLDAERYYDQQVMKQEWETIWTKSWLLAGLASDIAEPGDYFLFSIGHESIIISRDNAGQVQAMYNACQHRGNRVIATEQGSVPAFTCPYHGWIYDLDGTLQTVPDEERFEPRIDCDAYSLKHVKVEVWAGVVWVNMDLEAAPLADFLGIVQDHLTPYRIENMVLILDQTLEIDANWKTAVDNFNEQYHVDFIHPQHASMVNCRDSVNELWPYGHRRTIVEGFVTNPRYGEPEEAPPILDMMARQIGLNPDDFKGRVGDIRKAAQVQKRKLGEELGYSYDEFPDDLVSDVVQYDLFPNIIATIHPEYLWIMRPRPHPTDPNKCFFDKMTLQIPMDVGHDAESGLSLIGDVSQQVALQGARPEHDVFDREAVITGQKSMTITIDQDVHYLPDMQAGMMSAGFQQAVLNEDESRIQHFHDWWDVWMNDAPFERAQAKEAAE